MPIEARCVCGCTADVHRHHRQGSDCGEHGRWVCPRYVPLPERERRALTPAQRVALAESDAHLYRNLVALAPFALSARESTQAPVPAQRRPIGSVAGRYAQHLRDTRRRR